jgi:hypothetical protein
MTTIFTQEKKMDCLNKLKIIQDYTKSGENPYVYDHLKKYDIPTTYIPVLKKAGIIIVHKKRGKGIFYIWNTIEPNIHMAEKTLQQISAYNEKCSNNRKEKLAIKNAQNFKSSFDKECENLQKGLVNNHEPKQQEEQSYDPIENSSFKPVELCDIEICNRGEIQNWKSEIERLDKLNKQLEHQLDYAQNVEIKEVQEELVKAMNQNSEKALIIGNMALQIDKKDDEIKSIADWQKSATNLIEIVFKLRDTISNQNKIIEKLNDTIIELKQTPKPSKKLKTEEKPTRSFSILWGLVSIKKS